MPTAASNIAPHETRMTCMEVWGGSEAVDEAVTLSGVDVWVHSRPYGPDAEAGGDVYYVSACATGRINRILIADVAGHGHAVRQIAVDLRDLMRRFVNYLDQARFVTSMNRRFVQSSADGVFATAVVTTFFAPTRTLSLCNAGHPPPLLYRAATRQWSYLDNGSLRAANIPLGIVDLDDYEQFDVQLDVGDLVLVYTDALPEAASANGEQLGLAGLLALAGAACDPTKPATLIPALLDAIDRQTGDGLRADDVTALLIRPNGTGAKPALKDRLLAPVRIMKGIVGYLRGRGPAGLPEISLVNLGGNIISSLNCRWGRRGLRREAARRGSQARPAK